MKYDLIDPELYAWATDHGLQIFNDYQDYEVRSTDVVGSSGKKCQIWLEPSSSSTFVINVWDHKKRSVQLHASKTDITNKLEEAYRTAESWLSESS